MTIISKLKLPIHALAIAGSSSSFRNNPVLGSPNLNRRGLHVKRIKMAERMADSRRRRLARLVSKEHAEQYVEQGFVRIENVLPDDLFQQLSEEVETTRFAAREMKQGNAVTRFITLSPPVLRRTPNLKSFINGPLFQGVMRYVGSKNADPLVTLHTVLTTPGKGAPDPQTAYHSDTFHSTSKGWLFLRDVAVEDGPFSYIPGSHRLTSERLEWEYEQSINAADHKNSLHARGSFRASEDELASMGFPPFVQFPVKANSLVIADTHGFHARRPSSRPSVRLALYGSLRAHPFSPLTGPDVFDLPGLRNRKAQMLDWYRFANAKVTGRRESQPLVGELLPGDPSVR
ncbi:MAG: phytanoyl-CoA dioxygenase family protein [Pikeienuella sp.]